MSVSLKVPGDEVTLFVGTVEKVESTAKAGTFRYQIDGMRPDGSNERLYVNCPVADQQLKRLGFADARQLIGEAWRFYRVPAPNNTPAAGYLNIEPASGADLNKPAPTKREAAGITPTPAAAPDKWGGKGIVPGHPDDAPDPTDEDAPNGVAMALPTNDDRQTKIDKAYAHAWSVAFNAQGEAGSVESVQAGAATLMIAYEKAGVY